MRSHSLSQHHLQRRRHRSCFKVCLRAALRNRSSKVWEAARYPFIQNSTSELSARAWCSTATPARSSCSREVTPSGRRPGDVQHDWSSWQ